MNNLSNLIRRDKEEAEEDTLSIEEHLKGLDEALVSLYTIESNVGRIDDVEDTLTTLKGINQTVASHLVSLEASIPEFNFDFENYPIASFTASPSKTNLKDVNESLEDWKSAGIAALVVAIIAVIVRVGKWLRAKFFGKKEDKKEITKKDNPTTKAGELAKKIKDIKWSDEDLKASFAPNAFTNKYKLVNGTTAHILLGEKAKSGGDIGEIIIGNAEIMYNLMGEKDFLKSIDGILIKISDVSKNPTDDNIKEMNELIVKYKAIELDNLTKGKQVARTIGKFFKVVKEDDISAKLRAMLEAIKKQTDDDLKPTSQTNLAELYGKDVKSGSDLKDFLNETAKGLESFGKLSGSNNLYDNSIVKGYLKELEGFEKRLETLNGRKIDKLKKGEKDVSKALQFISGNVSAMNAIIPAAMVTVDMVSKGLHKFEELVDKYDSLLGKGEPDKDGDKT